MPLCFNPCFLGLSCNNLSFKKRKLDQIGNPEPVFGSNLFLKGLMFQSLFSQTLLQLTPGHNKAHGEHYFNPCFRRPFCNLQLVTTSNMGTTISILVFVDLFATLKMGKRDTLDLSGFNPYFLRPFCNKPFLRKKSFTKRTLFLLRIEYLYFL